MAKLYWLCRCSSFLVKPLLHQLRFIPQPSTLRGGHAVAFFEDPIEGGIVPEAAGCGRILCPCAGKKKVAGPIQADVQDVVPQGNAHTGLKERVHMNGTVMEHFVYEGQIPNIGVVPRDIVNDLIRQRIPGTFFSDEFVMRTADVNAVELDLLQKRKQDTEELPMYFSISFHTQTLYRGVYVGKAFLGKTLETLRAVGVFIKQGRYNILQFLIFGHGAGGELEV